MPRVAPPGDPISSFGYRLAEAGAGTAGIVGDTGRIAVEAVGRTAVAGRIAAEAGRIVVGVADRIESAAAVEAGQAGSIVAAGPVGDKAAGVGHIGAVMVGYTPVGLKGDRWRERWKPADWVGGQSWKAGRTMTGWTRQSRHRQEWGPYPAGSVDPYWITPYSILSGEYSM